MTDDLASLLTALHLAVALYPDETTWTVDALARYGCPRTIKPRLADVQRALAPSSFTATAYSTRKGFSIQAKETV